MDQGLEDVGSPWSLELCGRRNRDLTLSARRWDGWLPKLPTHISSCFALACKNIQGYISLGSFSRKYRGFLSALRIRGSSPGEGREDLEAEGKAHSSACLGCSVWGVSIRLQC